MHSMETRATAYLGLGANLGERLGTLRAAVGALDGHPSVSVDYSDGIASLYDTSPVGGPPDNGRGAPGNRVTGGVLGQWRPGELEMRQVGDVRWDRIDPGQDRGRSGAPGNVDVEKFRVNRWRRLGIRE